MSLNGAGFKMEGSSPWREKRTKDNEPGGSEVKRPSFLLGGPSFPQSGNWPGRSVCVSAHAHAHMCLSRGLHGSPRSPSLSLGATSCELKCRLECRAGLG